MSLSNALVYEGRLKYASENVGTRTLQLPSEWIALVKPSFQEMFDPKNRVVFVNYDPIIFSLSKKFTDKEAAVRKVIET
jgi:hypothetical protein